MNEKDIDPELSGVYKILETIVDCKILERDKKEQREKAQDKSQKESKQEILERIKRNSSGLVDRDTALTSKTWVAVLKSSLGNDNDASIAIQPVFKAWTGMPQFDSVSTAADSVQNNYNDWFRLLS